MASDFRVFWGYAALSKGVPALTRGLMVKKVALLPEDGWVVAFGVAGGFDEISPLL
jgi:hypothetical protein